MSDIIVRQVTAEDVQKIESWLPTLPLMKRYGLSKSDVQLAVSVALAANHVFLVAEKVSDVLALVWCLPQGTFGRYPYLRLLAVRPDAARNGLGKLLLEHIEISLQSNAKKLMLLVSDFNEEAQVFYKAMGYKQVGAIAGFVLPDVTELVFAKDFDDNHIAHTDAGSSRK